MLLMFALVPGLFPAVVGEIKAMFQYGATNIFVDVPWPWRVSYAAFVWDPLDSLFRLLVGTMFVAMPIFYLFGVIWLLRKPRETVKQHSIFAASVCVGILYMHYVFSRADLPHLVMGIFPFLTGVLAMPVPRVKYERLARPALVVGLLGMSVATVGYSDAMASHHVRKLRGIEEFVPVTIHDDTIWVSPDLAQVIRSVQKISADVVRPGETLLVAPHWPGLYPILGRESPTREVYFLFPATAEQQENMMRKLEQQNTNWVILGDVPLDGRDDLRFRSTHPLLWKHFQTDFEEVGVDGLPENYRLLRRRLDG